MKTLLLPALAATLILTNVGCGGGKKDSTEAAKAVNETKIDNEATSVKGENMDKDRQQDVSDFMVDLANTGATEYALSQLAAERATNKAVKTYARKAVIQHGGDEQALKNRAAAKNITLPTNLADKSRDMVAKLTGEKSGRNFDKRYLDEMADVNKTALEKARKLAETTKDESLKTYLTKLISDDQMHRAEAKKLADAL